jgi:hypothetical protein
LEWQGVPTGFLQATLEIGDWWDDCEVLGTTAVGIAAGERTLAVIEVSPVVSAPGSVRCTGTVRAGAFWREHGFDLRFNPLGKAKNWVHRSPSVRADDLVVDPSDPDLLHWELTLPAAGTWQLVFGTTALHADFEAVAPVTEGVNLVVPDPAELRFTVRDAVTDEVIEDAGLYWAYAGASVLESIIWTPPEYDGESGVHSLVIPAGRITAEVWADGYARTEAVELDLPPGVTEREWFLDPSAGALRFTFQEGENTIQANLMEWEVEVEPLDGEGDIDWISDDTIVFTAPGRYRIRMSGRAGYLPVELEAEAPLVGTDFVQVTIERE